jgi:VWFA-related protein
MRPLLLMVLAMALAAQEPAPVIRVTTRLVLLNVVVHEKNVPVRNLTARDFEILDGGHRREIAFFSMVTAKSAPAQPAAHTPANVFSNRAGARSETPTTATVLLLDGLNTDLRSKELVKEQTLRFLSKVDPNDKIAIYALGRELHIVHDFTDDREHLAKILARYRGGEAAEMRGSEVDLTNVLDPFIKDIMQNAATNEATFRDTVRGTTTLSALQAIANHLTTIPGRKNLIWVTGSFPFYPGFKVTTGRYGARLSHNFSEQVERTARWFNDANMAIYPVDARGIFDPYKSYGADTKQSSNIREESLKSPFHPDNFDTLKVMADRTGGVAYHDTNDLAGAIRRATEDAQVSYTLGFYPPAESLDGRYHEIKVQIHRKGVQSRYRKGYFANVEPPSAPETRAAALRDAVWSPLESNAVEIVVRADRTGKADPPTLALGIGINPMTFTIQPSKDGYAGALDIVLVESDAQGKVLRSMKHNLEVNLTRERYAARKDEWLTLHRTMDTAPGAALLRIIVQDISTGALGSVHLQLSKLLGGGSPPTVVR